MHQRGGLLQMGRLVQKELLHCIPKIHEEVPAIGDRPGVRRTLTNCFDVFFPAIPADDFNRRMRLEPSGNGGHLAIR